MHSQNGFNCEQSQNNSSALLFSSSPALLIGSFTLQNVHLGLLRAYKLATVCSHIALCNYT